MPAARDDDSIGDDKFLIRVLHPKWTVVKQGRERPTSHSLLDSNYENSCFIEGEISVEQVQQLFPGLKLARLPVRAIRDQGFAIERRPDEAPEACPNADAHVIVGPIDVPDRWGDYEGRARKIVKDPAVEIIPESER